MKVWDQTQSPGVRSDIPVPNCHCGICAQNINRNEKHLQKATGFCEQESQNPQIKMLLLIPSVFCGCRSSGGTSADIAAAWHMSGINRPQIKVCFCSSAHGEKQHTHTHTHTHAHAHAHTRSHTNANAKS